MSSLLINEIVEGNHYLPKPEILGKHRHYKDEYRPGDLFWGIGIEREFYLESASVREVNQEWILKNQRPERYSVRYFNSYKQDRFNNALKSLLPTDKSIYLPVLFNAHALLKCDEDGQHETTYERVPKPNPKHDGKVLFEYLLEGPNPFFRKHFGTSFCFDGDAIEIMTQNFYCTSVQQCVAELKWLVKCWITAANENFTYAGVIENHLPLRWAQENYGFANMWTNPANLSIFNNGTYHINLTAPTQLNKEGNIADRTDFVKRHRKITRIFQWIEPFLIAIYGTGDILSNIKNNYAFSRGSLRVAMSRYIGCGTFDSQAMPNGKCNTISASNIPITSEYGWYKMFHDNSAYTPLNEVGLDINFNKHYNHGIEFRIFDWFPENQLEGLIEILILLMDQALSLESIPDPRTNKAWNKLMERSVQQGQLFCIWKSELRTLQDALGLPNITGFKSEDIWNSIRSIVRKKWLSKGECSKLMIEKPTNCCLFSR
jgi:hypothetical protein